MARTRILLCLQCGLDNDGMTVGQGHDIPLGHGQQLCEVLSRSNTTVRSYGPGPDMDFCYVCTVTLTLVITLGQDHDTPMGLRQQVCEISRSDKGVRSYGLDTM